MNMKLGRICEMFVTLLIAGVLYSGCLVPDASAQNPQCPTRPFGDSSNACASTAFVQNALIPCSTLGAFLVGTGSGTQCSTVAGSAALLNGPMTIQPTTTPSSFGSLVVNLNTASVPLSVYGAATTIVSASANNSDTFEVKTAYGNNGTHNANPHIVFQTANGTLAAPTAIGTVPCTLSSDGVSSRDYMGTLAGSGHDGTSFHAIAGATLSFCPTELWTPSAAGSQARIGVTPNGGTNFSYPFIFNQDSSFTVNGNVNSTSVPPADGIAGSVRLRLLSSTDGFAFAQFDAYGTGLPGLIMRHAKGTMAVPTATQSGDQLGFVAFAGFATAFSITSGTQFRGYATQNWTGSNQGSTGSIWTTPDNSITTTLSTRFGQSGGVAVGIDSDTPVGVLSVLTGFRQGTMTAARVLRSDGTNFVSAQLACADLSTPCITGNQTITLSGDVTGSGTTAITTTLATVALAGTTGSSIAIPVITINAKGLTTSITTAAVVAPAGTLTGATLASGVTASSLTSLGTITSLTATTINAFILGGTISGGGNQINNVIIGTSTPLAITGTTITANTSVTSPILAGGSGAASTLTLESTSGAGTTDSILFKTASQTTRMSISTGGNIGFGANAPAVFFDINKNASNTATLGNMMRVANVDGQGATIEITAFGAGTGANVNGVRGNNTMASPTAVLSGDVLFQNFAYGYGSGSFNLSAAIQVVASENFSGSAAGSEIRFLTTPKTTLSIVTAMTVQPSGGVSVGTTTDPGIGSLQLNAQIFMPSITTTSAAQTGTVCWTTGTGKFTVDTTVGCLASSVRFKDVVGEMTSEECLDIALRLKTITFYKKPEYGGYLDPALQIGYGAEQAASVDERLIARGDDGEPRGVRYQQDSAISTCAIRQLKADNDNLRAELARVANGR